MSLLIKTSEIFEACRASDYKLLEEILTTRDKERYKRAIDDLHHYREHKTGLTPLLKASHATHDGDLVVLLLKHGADIAQEGMHRETALHLAARQGREDVLKRLLEYMDDQDNAERKKLLIDKRDAEGSTPLMCAVFAGDIPCMRLLREHGAFLDQRNYRGQTALIKAVCFRNNRVVDWLLTAGVDTLMRDNFDKQAKDYAAERKLEGMVEKISGKTVTDELDEWVDEKAHLTGMSSVTLPGAWDAPSVPSLAQQMIDAEKERVAIEAFKEKYNAAGRNCVSVGKTRRNLMDPGEYTYTAPPAEEEDYYALHEQEKIDGAWERFVDYDNDCPYWYNSLTGESQYWRPYALGGPEEVMDKDVASAKAAIFKSLISKGGSRGVNGSKEGGEEQ